MQLKVVLFAAVAAVAFAGTSNVNAAGVGAGAGQAASSQPNPDLMFSIGYIKSNLRKGKTTRADVIAAFGNPTQSKVNASDSGAVEVLYYQKGASQQQASGQSNKGGFARGLRSLAGLASGVAEMAGYNNTGIQAARAANLANRVAGGAETMSAVAGSNAPAPQQQQSGANVLTIELRDDILTAWTLN